MLFRIDPMLGGPWMLTERLDTLIAYKALSLVLGLTVADRRVAATILDHFNQETGRCDPSVDRIAELLGLDRTTVLRSIRTLDRLGLIRRVRHGGYSLRNSYEPVWSRFREIEAEWKARFNANSVKAGVARRPRGKWRGRHADGGASATQTYPINLSKEPVRAPADARQPTHRRADEVANGQARQGKNDRSTNPRPTAVRTRRRSPPARQAQAEAALRRWSNDLHRRFAEAPELYGKIVEAIDPELQQGATDAEAQRSGDGITYLIGALSHLVPPTQRDKPVGDDA